MPVSEQTGRRPPTTGAPAGGSDWFRASFATDYLTIYRHRDEAEAEQAVNALLDRLDLPAGSRCLDLCCGAGRHLFELRRRGLHAVGLDLSAELLNEATRTAPVRGRLVRGDMRLLPFRQSFDCVFSFFTSFGYFTADIENQAVLLEIARVLRPGGRFMIDYLNATRVRETLIPEDSRRLDDLTLHQQRWLDETTNTVEKRLSVTDASGTRHYRESVKLYGRHDFRRFCQAAGLTLDACFGDADGAPWQPDSPRLIVTGRHLP